MACQACEASGRACEGGSCALAAAPPRRVPPWVEQWETEDAVFQPPPMRIGFGQLAPSSTAMSIAGAVACGLAGWWIAGMIKDDENSHLMGAGIGAITGLILF